MSILFTSIISLHGFRTDQKEANDLLYNELITSLHPD